MRNALFLSLVFCLLIATAGCKDATKASSSGNPPPAVAVETHSHPSTGPHKGDVIELGHEEFHAEIVHDDASVTIYILDSAAKAAVPIEATELVINLKHDGKPEQFKLASSPDTGDAAGKSSRFTLKDADLAARVDAEGADAKLTVTINGKHYTGEIKHDHDH